MVLNYWAVLYDLVLIEVLVEDSTICSPSRAVVEETEVPAHDVNPRFLSSLKKARESQVTHMSKAVVVVRSE
jgi:hypothetical protein